jgi:hypothetical protein
MIITSNIGMLCLAVYMIIVGITAIAGIAVPGIITGILALAAGILLLIGK